MSPLDPRRDSPDPSSTPTREMGASSEMREVLKHLGRIGEDIAEVRAHQKAMALDVGELKGAHSEQARGLQHLGSQFLELKSEVAHVRTLAEKANDGQLRAHQKVSDTQHGLQMTLESVKVSQNLVADKAEAVAEKTDKIVAECATQTKSLSELAAVNVVQVQKLNKQDETLDKIRKFAPMLNAAAIAVATALAYALNAWGSLHH